MGGVLKVILALKCDGSSYFGYVARTVTVDPWRVSADCGKQLDYALASITCHTMVSISLKVDPKISRLCLSLELKQSYPQKNLSHRHNLKCTVSFREK